MMPEEMEDMQSQIEQLRANRGKKRLGLDFEDDDMTLTKDNKNPKNDDGVIGVLTFQCIIAIIIAIIYVLLMTFYRPLAFEIKNLILDISTNDFSFKDKVYDTVGDTLTFLNKIEPIKIEETSSDETSSDNIVEEDSTNAVAEEDSVSAVKEDVSSNNESSSAVADDKKASVVKETDVKPVSKSGAGGEPNPVDENEIPANATFAPVIFTGRITFPIEKNYIINSMFGFREHPSQGIPEFHTGVDIGASKGTPIMAVANGVVIKSEKGVSLGNYIVIDHSNGFLTVYGHCDKLIAKVGSHIREGEVIAKVGSTGDSTGNHLHFAMKKDNLYFDPSYIFKDEINAKI